MNHALYGQPYQYYHKFASSTVTHGRICVIIPWFLFAIFNKFFLEKGGEKKEKEKKSPWTPIKGGYVITRIIINA